MTQSTLAEAQGRISAVLQRPGFSAVTLAGLAKVHPNTIRDCDQAGWNPQVQTLDRIMRVVDAIEAIESQLERQAKE